MAHPWWVNFAIAVPFLSYLYWQRVGISLTAAQLLFSALFAVAFGVVEGIVVVYLRAALGAVAGYGASVSEVMRFSESLKEGLTVGSLPVSLWRIETLREAATMLMLVSVALLATPNRRERWAIFLWSFAIWDITYYVTLFATMKWPSSLRDADILFLIPVPWIAPVWLPLVVSTLTAFAVVRRGSVMPSAARHPHRIGKS
jgi:hypothetical protein